MQFRGACTRKQTTDLEDNFNKTTVFAPMLTNFVYSWNTWISCVRSCGGLRWEQLRKNLLASPTTARPRPQLSSDTTTTASSCALHLQCSYRKAYPQPNSGRWMCEQRLPLSPFSGKKKCEWVLCFSCQVPFFKRGCLERCFKEQLLFPHTLGVFAKRFNVASKFLELK